MALTTQEIINYVTTAVIISGVLVGTFFCGNRYGYRPLRRLFVQGFHGPVLYAFDTIIFLLIGLVSFLSPLVSWSRSDVFRRRDFLSRHPVRHKLPSVIPNTGGNIENFLNRYGHYLNLNAQIPDTNATIFRIRNWLRCCARDHNGQGEQPNCKPLEEEDRGCPLWLIDIEQQCLVPYHSSLTYFALSYV